MATIKQWISSALGTLGDAGGPLSPPSLVKLHPLLAEHCSRPSALSVSLVAAGGPTARTAGPSHTPPSSQSATSAVMIENKDPRKSNSHHVCSRCFDSFPMPVMLAMHSLNHVEEKPFTCPYPSCHYNSVMRGNVKRHIRISHSHQNFPC